MPCRPAPCNWRKCLGSRNTVPRDRARPRSAGEGCPPDRAATGQSGSSSADRRSMCRESAGRWGAVDHCGIPGPEQGTLSEGCVARCTGQASNCGARAATSGASWQRFQRGRCPCQLQPLRRRARLYRARDRRPSRTFAACPCAGSGGRRGRRRGGGGAGGGRVAGDRACGRTEFTAGGALRLGRRARRRFYSRE